jgi:HK97 family phage major capsid protein
MLERRATLTAEMRGILANAGENDLGDEQRARFDGLRTEADALQARIERQAVVDEMERRASGTPIGATGDNRFDAEVRQFSIVRAIASQVPGLNADAGREREISAELARRSGRTFQGIAVPLAALERRTLTAASTSGDTIATDLMASEFVDRLWPALVIRQLGARVLTGLVGNVSIPKLTGAASGYWVADNAAVTESDQQFAQINLTPKHAGALTEFSRNLLLQSTPDIESLVRADLAQVLAQVLDQAAINGSGANNQPRGILQTSGIGSVALGTNGAALGYGNVVDLMGQVQDMNAETARSGFLSNFKVRRAAQKMLDSMNRPLGENVVFQNTARAFTNNVPANLSKGTGTNLSALIYGDFAQLLIGVWSELDVLVNPFGPNYAAGNVQIRAMLTCDINVRHAESFAAITDIAA